jgi:hypothetical protein
VNLEPKVGILAQGQERGMGECTLLRKHSKESNGMTLRLRVLLLVVLTAVLVVGVAAVFLLGYGVRELLNEDRCLDRGGRWKADPGVCEYLPRPNESARRGVSRRGA